MRLGRQDVADPEIGVELECPPRVGDSRVEIATAKGDLRRHPVLERVQGIELDGRLRGDERLGVPAHPGADDRLEACAFGGG